MGYFSARKATQQPAPKMTSDYKWILLPYVYLAGFITPDRKEVIPPERCLLQESTVDAESNPYGSQDESHDQDRPDGILPRLHFDQSARVRKKKRQSKNPERQPAENYK
ncbi:hypothetical protein SCARD494_08397 [Seiridium cardinale]